MGFFKYLIFCSFFFSSYSFAYNIYKTGVNSGLPVGTGSSAAASCQAFVNNYNQYYTDLDYKERAQYSSSTETQCFYKWALNPSVTGFTQSGSQTISKQVIACPSATSVDLKVSTSSGSYVCTGGCQYKLKACVDVDFEAGMTCSAISTGQDCGIPPPTTTPTTPPVSQDPTNPTDKTEEQTTFENIMHVIGEKLDGIKDAINGGNQNQDGDDTGGSTGGNTGSEVNVNVDMSETNAKIDETNSLIDELMKWFQGEDLGDDIFGDQEPPEKELTPQQLDTDIFSGGSQCPADAKLNFKLLGGKSFTKTFEFRDWCDKLEIFGSFILIASYLFGAYIIVSKS